MQKEILDKIADNYTQILEALGLDLTDPNLVETPRRVAKSYGEIFKALSPEADEELNDILGKTFPATYNEMVVTKNIVAWSMCPHHFLPVRYDVAFAYIPDKSVLGLSKMPRAIQLMAAKPVLQEQFTTDIVKKFESVLKPKGCIVRVSGEHLCMQMRGVKSTDSCVITNAFSGCFENETSKAEFFRSL
jgi:GTP cyclohydrolase I